MDVFKIVGIGLIGTVMALVLKQTKPELAILVSMATAVAIFLFVTPYFKAIIDMFEELTNMAGLNPLHVGLVLKIIGVAYVIQFGAELCRDAGEGAIASKIELGGKITLLAMSMPIIYGLINLIRDIVL